MHAVTKKAMGAVSCLSLLNVSTVQCNMFSESKGAAMLTQLPYPTPVLCTPSYKSQYTQGDTAESLPA